MTHEQTDVVSCKSCGEDIVAALRARVREFHWNVDHTGQCWTWLGRKHAFGYGVFWLGRRDAILAHRAAWILANGWIESDQHVLHRCDNPSCVRLEHLFLGTQLDNIADMVSKGRQSRGSRHSQSISEALSRLRTQDPERFERGVRRGRQNGHSKLTDKEVRIIRSCLGTSRQVGAIFGVSAAVVRDVRLRRTWRHVD